MEKEVFDFVAEQCKILATTGSSKQCTKDAAQAWLDAVAADEAAADEATATLLDYLDGRPHSIDGTIAFAQGPAVAVMGQEAADAMLQKAIAAKETGVKFCLCDACTAASKILAKFGRVEL